jgi:hypothetical protein
MKTNIGTLDRIVRVLLGAGLLAFGLGFIAPDSAYRWLGWIGVVPLATAAVGFCPLYRLAGLSTRPAGRSA